MKKLALFVLLLLALPAVGCHGGDGDEFEGCEAADLDHSGRVDGYDLVLATQQCNNEETVALVQRCFGAHIGHKRTFPGLPWN